MTDIATELLAMARETLTRIDVPPIARVVLPRPRPVGEQDADFRLIALRDGSTGVFYAWLGETMSRLSESVRVEDLPGVDLADLVEGYQSTDPARPRSDWERSQRLASTYFVELVSICQRHPARWPGSTSGCMITSGWWTCSHPW